MMSEPREDERGEIVDKKARRVAGIRALHQIREMVDDIDRDESAKRGAIKTILTGLLVIAVLCVVIVLVWR